MKVVDSHDEGCGFPMMKVVDSHDEGFGFPILYDDLEKSYRFKIQKVESTRSRREATGRHIPKHLRQTLSLGIHVWYICLHLS